MSVFSYENTSLVFEWESVKGGDPSGYIWEAQHSPPVEGAKFGDWSNKEDPDFSDTIPADTTSKAVVWAGSSPGRWRVKAYNQTGESDWSEWYYFDFGVLAEMVNLGINMWDHVTYGCFHSLEAGETISLNVSFFLPEGGTTWYVQLLDPEGEIERSWTSGGYPSFQDPWNLQIEHQVQKSGIYSIRIINYNFPSVLRATLRIIPTDIDLTNCSSGITSGSWHIVK